MEDHTPDNFSKPHPADSNKKTRYYETTSAADAASVMLVVAVSAVLSVTLNPLGKLSDLTRYWSSNNLDELVGTLLISVVGLFWYYWRRWTESNRLLEIRKREKEIFEANYNKLKELEDMKDSLTHMIVHDMNGPLSVMTGAIQLIEMYGKEALGEQQKSVLEASDIAGQDLRRMIENLLDINAMEEGALKLNFSGFSVRDAVMQAAEKMKIQAQIRSIRLAADAAEGMPAVAADKDLIMRVIYNLIANAINYTPENGSVAVSAFHDKEKNIFSVSVRGSGSGIPQEYLHRIFDKFVRVGVKDAGQRTGRGLGLTFCRMAVEAHGGRIWAESKPGHGSLFTFTLPQQAAGKKIRSLAHETKP